MAVAARNDLGRQPATQEVNVARDTPHGFTPGFVRLATLIEFEQVRKTMNSEELGALGLSIRNRGLISPPLVAIFDEEEISAYLSLLNGLWKTDYRVSSLSFEEQDGRRLYNVLVAGHRRVRACREIARDLAASGPIPPYFRHVEGELWLEARLGINIPAFNALCCQFHENTYSPPPLPETARAYDALWRLMSEADQRARLAMGGPEQKLTLKAFAAAVGASDSKIRSALRFCILPLAMQQAVEQGVLVYGIAVELARLTQAGCDEAEFAYWLKRAVSEQYTVPVLRRKISAYLTNKADSGQTLLELMTAAQLKQSQSQAVRQRLSLELRRGLIVYQKFLNQVRFLVEHGYLTLEESPLHCLQAVANLRQVIGDVQELIGHLGAIYSESDLHILRSTLEYGDNLAQSVLDLGS